MLGLYEVAHLRVHGEDILDEALAFTTTHLKSLVEHLEYPLAVKVNKALYRPFRKQGLTYQSIKIKLHIVKLYWNLPS